jgi:Fe-S oxidoreductase
MSSSQNQAVANCNLCGACNLNCPFYFVLLKESAGARFKAFLAKKKQFREVFFLCTTCTSCLQDCPARIDLECLEIRRRLVESGFETPANKVMKNNIQQFKNPFGEIKKDMKIKKYYT